MLGRALLAGVGVTGAFDVLPLVVVGETLVVDAGLDCGLLGTSVVELVFVFAVGDYVVVAGFVVLAVVVVVVPGFFVSFLPDI